MRVADRASASCPARHPIRLIAPDRDRPSQTSSNQVKAQGSAVVHRLVHPQGGGQGPLAGLVVRSVVVCQGRDRWAITHPQWIRLARLLELCLVELRSRGQGVRDDRRSIDWIGWPWKRESFLSLFLSPTWLSGPSLASFFLPYLNIKWIAVRMGSHPPIPVPTLTSNSGIEPVLTFRIPQTQTDARQAIRHQRLGRW